MHIKNILLILFILIIPIINASASTEYTNDNSLLFLNTGHIDIDNAVSEIVSFIEKGDQK